MFRDVWIGDKIQRQSESLILSDQIRLLGTVGGGSDWRGRWPCSLTGLVIVTVSEMIHWAVDICSLYFSV